MADPVIIAYPTIMDGLVLRFYKDPPIRGTQERLSVSRNGTLVYDYIQKIPAAWWDTARLAYDLLLQDWTRTATRLATHRWAGTIDQLEQINRCGKTSPTWCRTIRDFHRCYNSDHPEDTHQCICTYDWCAYDPVQPDG